MLAAHLRVKSAFLAVTPTPDHTFVTLPVGAMIEHFDDLAEPGFVHVMCEGKDLLAFTRDILERTEKVKAELPVSPR